MSKDINELSLRLAAMRLELLAYPVELEYRKGVDMVIADRLSRLWLGNTDLFEDLEVDPLVSEWSVVIQNENVMSNYQRATDDDEELDVARRYIQHSWPTHNKSWFEYG